VIEELLEPLGGRFGPAFDPGDVQRQFWGRAELRVEGCDTVHTQWWPVNPAFEGGERGLDRLTSLAGLECGGP
jgi:hypothetical protein